MNTKERIEIAREKAIAAFWSTFAKEFPEIKTGDLNPVDNFKFNKTIKEVVNVWVHENNPLFSAIFSTGIGYADRTREENGDYKKLAFLSFRTLELEFYGKVPEELRKLIVEDANAIQVRKGEEYQVSACGQTITLGYGLLK
ncbi:MAG: hypothetical protein M0Q13_14160 [Methanothrix sp.]|jgi:hypothetical protein|nr:hypothetical protein [Methanothrix sp.]